MAEMIKILKNTTDEPITRLGIIIPANGSLSVPLRLWLKLADDMDESDNVYQDIQNGNIIVNDGTDDLSIVDGVRWCTILASWKNEYANLHKRSFLLPLIKNAAADSSWLSVGGESGVPSNNTPWSPPFDVKVVKVIYSSRFVGKSNSPTVTQVRCYGKEYADDNSFNTDDDLAWYVQGDGENAEMNSGYGKMWKYNNEDGDNMYANYQYAFHVKKLSGTKSPNDVQISLLLEEI